MRRNNYSDYSIAQNQAQQMGLDSIKSGAKRAKRVGTVMAKKGLQSAKKGAGMALGAVKANPGKAGLALAGLAAAGGLGVAGMKALGARKKKANSLQGRLADAVNKNPTLNKASKMFR